MRTVISLFPLALFGAGCLDFHNLSSADLSQLPDFAQPVDMAQPVDLEKPLDFSPPPDMTPDVHFSTGAFPVQADIDALGCAATGCHAVATGTYVPLLQASPGPVAEMQNWANFKAEAGMILSKCLAGNGVTHAGAANVKPFASESDPVYVRWADWLAEGQRY